MFRALLIAAALMTTPLLAQAQDAATGTLPKTPSTATEKAADLSGATSDKASEKEANGALTTPEKIQKTKEANKQKQTGKAAGKTTGKANKKGDKAMGNPIVHMETSMGGVDIELYEDKAPISVKNFLRYVDEKFYDGLIFHRVINNFMIQGGGFTPDMKQKSVHEPIKNEAANGLKNTTGTLAMARTGEVDSATAQFFVNVKDNTFLDHSGPANFGYAVFGKVTSGMDVVEKIKHVPTGHKGMYDDVPETPVVIKSIVRK